MWEEEACADVRALVRKAKQDSDELAVFSIGAVIELLDDRIICSIGNAWVLVWILRDMIEHGASPYGFCLHRYDSNMSTMSPW